MLLFFFISYVQAICKSKVFMTDCDKQLKRTIWVMNSPECPDVSNKIEDFDCRFECPAGSFLEFSSKGDVLCKPCKEGTFSLGGATIFGSKSIPWADSLKSGLYSECWVKVNGSEYHNYLCEGWKEENSVLSSSKPNVNHSYTASLVLSVQIVKQGFFHIRYRKDSFKMNGLTVGTFSVFINNIKVFEDSHLRLSEWRLFKHPLTIGKVEVLIEYSVISDDFHQYPKAEISSIEVVGDKFADFQCLPCPAGSSKEGAFSCDICDENQYAEDGNCLECPEDTFSIQGSVGKDSCKLRKPCQDLDMKKVFSPCIDNIRNLTFELIKPVMCDFSAFQLPAQQIVPCGECEKGSFRVNGTQDCTTCEKNQFFNESFQQCSRCPPGHYIETFLNFTEWSPLPAGFVSYCLTVSGWACNPDSAWIAHQGYLTTLLSVQQDEIKHLYRKINIINHKGKLNVAYLLNSIHSRIDVYVDGVVVKVLQKKEEGLNQDFVEVFEGFHDVELVFWTLSELEVEARIYFFEVWGSDEGARIGCEKCDRRHAGIDGVKCFKCREGYEADDNKSRCVLCRPDFYSSIPGESCKPCPEGSFSSENRTFCLGRPIIKQSDTHYYLGNITGVGKNEQLYSGGICDMPSSQLYCHQTFYGPLHLKTKDFYLSVMNPSILSLNSIPNLFNPRIGYAFGVFQKPELTHKRLTNDESCEEDRVIVNLGSKLESISNETNGILIKYSEGDTCDHFGNFFQTTLRLVCDKSTGIGWPSLESSSNCSFHFLWKSKYGCPICPYKKLKTLETSCSKGIKTFKKVEGKDCIIPYSFDIEWTISCSELAETLNSKEMIFGFVLLGALIVLGAVSTVFFFKYKQGYELLSQDTERTGK